ncbi:MAG TPA: heme-binding protein [Burkholderiales bacterium]|jgi:uncharacterized protein GlcG (DUF336 family)|nr:heme-binding protein [Burkholderiales bacterium]
MKLPVLAFAGALVSFNALAQQKPNPLDNVPDKMPFDVPYGMPISLERAQHAVQAATAEAQKRGWKMNVAVVDPGGQLIAFARMDGAQVASVAISQHKARAAATYRRETKVFETGIQAGFNYLMTLDDIIASRGGIPLVQDGKLVGAIGCSGGTGSQDELVCQAGVAALGGK